MTAHHYRQEHRLDNNPRLEIPLPIRKEDDSVQQESEPSEIQHGD